MSSKTGLDRLYLVLILILVVFTRFYGLFWGGGYYFHPDENNMATALSRLTPDSLNPHFFAYGQLPLYLGYFVLWLLNISNTFGASIGILRITSALAGVATIIFLFFLWKLLFPKKSAFLFLVLLTFSPGLIQISHFGTTESLLSLFFIITLILSTLVYKDPTCRKYYFYYSLILGLSVATKISSLIFLIPLIISFVFINFKTKFKSIYSSSLSLMVVLFSSACLSLLFSPSSFYNLGDFISSLTYETGVATGSIPVFYTRQFENTRPYLYQLTRVFPYVWGLPVLFFTMLGLIYKVPLSIKNSKLNPLLLIVILSCLAYFLYFGQTYTKWTRFQSPIFFLGPFITAQVFQLIKNRLLLSLWAFISVIPGVFFTSLYFKNDIRVEASLWLNANIPPNSYVLSEAGNVVNLPVLPHAFNVVNFDFYQVDSSPGLAQELGTHLNSADYILIPSRRIFKNQNNSRYPVSQNYYHQLFSPASNFKLIKTFSPGNSFILNSENAEETFTVFDHPTIRVYQKI